VSGSLNVDGSTVGVTFEGLYYSPTTQTNGGTNYWEPSAPFISASVDNAPPASDIIALNDGGSKTITFSQTIKDPILALVSWNGVTVDFGVPIQILSSEVGFFGSGTPILNSDGTGFNTGQIDEFHGVIRLPGEYSSITFTDTLEGWHGFTVGVTSLASTSPVPEPSTFLLLGAGLAGVGFLRRRAKK
jgi:hypothetical protein